MTSANCKSTTPSLLGSEASHQNETVYMRHAETTMAQDIDEVEVTSLARVDLDSNNVKISLVPPRLTSPLKIVEPVAPPVQNIVAIGTRVSSFRNLPRLTAAPTSAVQNADAKIKRCGPMDAELQKIYDRFAETYDSNRAQFEVSEVFKTFYQRLSVDNGRVLDLGCGAGEPFARWFVERGWHVTGVDISEKMLSLAQTYVPTMKTIRADMCALEFDQHCFDAILASYSFFHVPRERHCALLRKFFRWLRPGGKAMFTYATEKYTGAAEFHGYKEFMGESLFYSHNAPATLFTNLENIGFTVDSAEYKTIGGETFLWVLIGKCRDSKSSKKCSTALRTVPKLCLSVLNPSQANKASVSSFDASWADKQIGSLKYDRENYLRIIGNGPYATQNHCANFFLQPGHEIVLKHLPVVKLDRHSARQQVVEAEIIFKDSRHFVAFMLEQIKLRREEFAPEKTYAGHDVQGCVLYTGYFFDAQGAQIPSWKLVHEYVDASVADKHLVMSDQLPGSQWIYQDDGVDLIDKIYAAGKITPEQYEFIVAYHCRKMVRRLSGGKRFTDATSHPRQHDQAVYHLFVGPTVDLEKAFFTRTERFVLEKVLSQDPSARIQVCCPGVYGRKHTNFQNAFLSLYRPEYRGRVKFVENREFEAFLAKKNIKLDYSEL